MAATPPLPAPVTLGARQQTPITLTFTNVAPGTATLDVLFAYEWNANPGTFTMNRGVSVP